MFCYSALSAPPPVKKPKQKLFGTGSKYLPGFGGAPSTPTPTPPKAPSSQKSSGTGTWLALGALGVGLFFVTR